MKAELSDLAMALESTGMEHEHISRFDRRTGEIAYVEADVLRSVEEDPDYDGSDLPDWQRKEVETACALLADDGTRFIDPPSRDTRDEFEIMREFAEQWPDESVASDLLKHLGGRGSFRRFREAVFEHRIEDQWRTFRDEKERDFLIGWCRENNVEYEDNLHIGPPQAGASRRAGPPQHETSDREHLLAAAQWFIAEAAKLESVEQIALVGSLCTEQKKPRDLDLLVTVKPGSSIKALGKLKRKLQGKISRGSMGSDVFIAEDGPGAPKPSGEGGRYIGRACQYREPWLRADCMARKLRCADGREFLCDTSANFRLDQEVIDNPPVILWPEVKQNVEVPADVQKLMAAIGR